MPEPQITTARSARLDLPFLFPGQAQKEAFVNEALARLDGLVQPVVLDERNDPPVDPAPGDCHIVGAAPVGDWAGHAGDIALWEHSQWLFTAARAGMVVYDQATGSLARYVGGEGWIRTEAPAEPSGGTVIDAEMRAAFAALIANLRSLGFFA